MPKAPKAKSVLDLNYIEARKFFIRPNSYNNTDLPPYIKFKRLLVTIDKYLSRHQLGDVSKRLRSYDDINYTLLSNKDGKYAWRPLQLIHPILYVRLVHEITSQKHWEDIKKSFTDFSADKKIECVSLPVTSRSSKTDKAKQILRWWTKFEQRSIALSLRFNHMIQTDITDCYGSIYTHSIAWALHSKSTAKNQRNNKKLIGNIIDSQIQDMRYGQTNGIPQGSVLMDFIAEIVLGYIDSRISESLEVFFRKAKRPAQFQILRYRDDYRIFTNNQEDGAEIVKVISKEMIDIGLKLSSAKTKSSNEIIISSIKPDKLSWLYRKQVSSNIQKQSLIVHDHSLQHPNSGSLKRALSELRKEIKIQSKLNLRYIDPEPIIAIITDIACRNPGTYGVCIGILGDLFSLIKTKKNKASLAQQIKGKFRRIPNTGLLEIWLQRILIPLNLQVSYSDEICKLVAGDTGDLWNIKWIEEDFLKAIIKSSPWIDKSLLKKLPPQVASDEYDPFESLYD